MPKLNAKLFFQSQAKTNMQRKGKRMEILISWTRLQVVGAMLYEKGLPAMNKTRTICALETGTDQIELIQAPVFGMKLWQKFNLRKKTDKKINAK